MTEQVEGRLGKRPWTPSEEVSILRAFAITMDSFNVLVGEPMLKLKKNNSVDGGVSCVQMNLDKGLPLSPKSR